MCAYLYIVLKGQCLNIVCNVQILRPASVLGLCVDDPYNRLVPPSSTRLAVGAYSKQGSCPRLWSHVWQRLAGASASPVGLGSASTDTQERGGGQQ